MIYNDKKAEIPNKDLSIIQRKLNCVLLKRLNDLFSSEAK